MDGGERSSGTLLVTSNENFPVEEVHNFPIIKKLLQMPILSKTASFADNEVPWKCLKTPSQCCHDECNGTINVICQINSKGEKVNTFLVCDSGDNDHKYMHKLAAWGAWGVTCHGCRSSSVILCKSSGGFMPIAVRKGLSLLQLYATSAWKHVWRMTMKTSLILKLTPSLKPMLQMRRNEATQC